MFKDTLLHIGVELPRLEKTCVNSTCMVPHEPRAVSSILHPPCSKPGCSLYLKGSSVADGPVSRQAQSSS